MTARVVSGFRYLIVNCRSRFSLISLGIVWIQRGDHVQSLKFLTQAEQHYQVILSARSGGRVGEGPELILEALYTQTCFYLAQIYTKQNETVKAAFYCHRTLNRQLTLRSTTLQFDPVEWSSNCIKLSAFYISSGRLSQARYCLDAAEAINSCIEKNGPRDSVSADFHCAAAEIFASQLHMSAKLLSNASLNGEIDVSIDQFESLPDLPKAEFGFVRKFCEAQQVFRCGYDAYQLALKFYQLDGFVTDYVALLQKCCQLMKDFSTFSSDPAFICKLLKRSIDLAEPVLDQLNPKIYTDYVRQFSYDVAEWYSEMSALKEQQYSSKGVMDATRSKKINYLIWKAIHRFEALSKLCSSNERSAVTDEKFLINNGSNVDVVHLKTFLSARFQIARLYSRIIPANRSSQVSFLKQSLGEYESIVALCRIRQNQQSNLDSISQFCQELAISVEMCSLLPLKISKISSGAG
uniref:KIF-binding protein n=1 Tax=Spongospora subterranea TaxID=70186 RepID=A0A0H5QQB1_9EUKA|eukprot:CRZ04270.1 hypothetical protein [Spongospora subterranea]